MPAVVYLIPSVLDDTATQTIPAYIIEAVKSCQVIFAENERTARRFLKSICKEIVIDNYEWFAIHKAENRSFTIIQAEINPKKKALLLSARQAALHCRPRANSGWNSPEVDANNKAIGWPQFNLLALMANGMNGQQFRFVGYLPIDNGERIKKLKRAGASSEKNNSTKIFYRNTFTVMNS